MTARRARGQALVEYILLMFMIAGMIGLLNRAMPAFLARLEAPIRKDFRLAYRNGHPEACGYEDSDPCSGQPEKHPRHDTGGENFRLFGRQAD
jgi:hypothetical protein